MSFFQTLIEELSFKMFAANAGWPFRWSCLGRRLGADDESQSFEVAELLGDRRETGRRKERRSDVELARRRSTLADRPILLRDAVGQQITDRRSKRVAVPIVDELRGGHDSVPAS